MRGGWRLESETKTRTFLKQEEKHSMVCRCSYLFIRVVLPSSHHGHETFVFNKIWINSWPPSQQGGDEGLRRLSRSRSALTGFEKRYSPASCPPAARETRGIQWFLKINSYPGTYVKVLEFKQSCRGSSSSFHDLLGAQRNVKLLLRFQWHTGASAWGFDPHHPNGATVQGFWMQLKSKSSVTE